MAGFQSNSASQTSKSTAPEVVEIGLLLPASRVHALIELSKKKQQSVGQILRSLIDHALVDGELAEDSDDLLDASGADGLGTFV
jgi:hypothetical protein